MRMNALNILCRRVHTTTVAYLVCLVFVLCGTTQIEANVAQRFAGNIGLHSFKWLLPNKNTTNTVQQKLAEVKQAVVDDALLPKLKKVKKQLAQQYANLLEKATEKYEKKRTALKAVIEEIEKKLKSEKS